MKIKNIGAATPLFFAFSLVIALNFGFKTMMGFGLVFYGMAYIVIYSVR